MIEANGYEFAEDEDRYSYLLFEVKEDVTEITVCCSYLSRYIEGYKVKPRFLINFNDLNVKSVSELVGKSVECDNYDECNEKNYIFRYSISNPMQNFKLNFLEVKDNMIHVMVDGVGIIDYDEEPMITVDFSLDSWIQIDSL